MKKDELARAEDARSAPASTLDANVIEAWEVQRVDHDNGQIVYEVWSVKPYAFLFGIHDDLTPNAKAIAEGIVADHNRAPVPPAPPPQDNAHVAPGCERFPETGV